MTKYGVITKHLTVTTEKDGEEMDQNTRDSLRLLVLVAPPVVFIVFAALISFGVIG